MSMTLVEKVKKLNEELPNNQDNIFSKEVLEALKLAEQFKDIEPEEYILPLDALAGFTTNK